MSDANKNESPKYMMPDNLPEELWPLYDWWKAKGPASLIQTAAFILLAVGVYAGFHYYKGRGVEASRQVASAEGVDELEAYVKTYGGTGAGLLGQMRLAKAYYDNGRAEDALSVYEKFVNEHPTHDLVTLAVMGKAQSLEAMGRYDDALLAYKAFAKDFPEHYLAPATQLGIARVWAYKGDKAESKSILDALIQQHKDTLWEEQAERLSKVIERYVPGSTSRSLFDLADAAAKQTAKDAAEQKSAVVPLELKPEAKPVQ